MTKLLQSHWTAAGLGLILYLATTLLLWHPQTAAQHSPATPVRKAGPSWTFQNPELDQLLAELKREKEALAEKEKQLQDLALRLQSERQELNQITQLVQTLQAEFDLNVIRVQEQEGANLRKLAKVYAAMAPDNAVPILKQMDEPTLVKLLALMKDAEAAIVLEALGRSSEADAKRAAELSERLRLFLPRPASAAPNAP